MSYMKKVLVLLFGLPTLKNIFSLAVVRALIVPNAMCDNCTTCIETERIETEKEHNNFSGFSNEAIANKRSDSIEYIKSRADEYSTITAQLASSRTNSKHAKLISISNRWNACISSIKERIQSFMSSIGGLWRHIVSFIRSRLFFFMPSKSVATNDPQQKGFSPSYMYSVAQTGYRKFATAFLFITFCCTVLVTKALPSS